MFLCPLLIRLFISLEGTIGMFGGISIAVNSLTGPAMLSLPATFQRSGLIPTITALLLVCFLSGSSSSIMANIISSVPGNDNFQREVSPRIKSYLKLDISSKCRMKYINHVFLIFSFNVKKYGIIWKIEFSDTFRIFLGDAAFTFTQFAYYGCVTCLNIASIVDISQVLDSIISHNLISTVALQWTHGRSLEIVQWDQDACTDHQVKAGICIPFHQSRDHFIITVGYVLAAIIFIPMSLMDMNVR